MKISSPPNRSVTLEDIQDAERVISPHITATPLWSSRPLNTILGLTLHLKFETFNPTGSFKSRGAANQIGRLTVNEKQRGVFAVSSGNWAQAIAYMARAAGIKATILMPHNAPQTKIQKTRDYGATVEFYDRGKENREEKGLRIAQERDLVMLHPFNDVRTIAGQGTAGLEVRRQAREMKFSPDSVVVPTSGGGFVAGVTVAMSEKEKKTPQIYAAEPETYDDMCRSLAAGHIVRNEVERETLCDALTAPEPGEIPFAILCHYGVKGLTASDEDALAAMRVIADYFKVIAEPGGAIGLATVLRHHEKFQGQNVVVMISGGNTEKYEEKLERGRVRLQTLFPALAA